MADIQKYAPKLWRLEGGFVNDPNDKGGATNHGVTLNAYEVYCLQQGKKKPTVEDLKNLSWDEFVDITKMHYWNRWQADKIINQSLAELLVDWTYNSGSWGVKIPQKVLGLVDDGIVGNKTLFVVNSNDAQKVFDKIWAARKEFFEGIVKRDPSQKKFLAGWLNRLNEFKFEES